MSAKTESNRLGDVLKFEAEKAYSREQVTFGTDAGAPTLAVGTVVGKVTASGKYKILAPAANDGTESAAGVVVQEIALSASADTTGVIVNKFAKVAKSALVFPDGATTNQKNTAIAQLEVLGVEAEDSY